MYFSFTVLTSTGFGEITPVTDMARALIVIEQVLGVMYVAFLVARLANLYGTKGATDGVRGGSAGLSLRTAILTNHVAPVDQATTLSTRRYRGIA